VNINTSSISQLSTNRKPNPLDGRSDRAQDDQIIEHPRLVPFTVNLTTQRFPILFGQQRERLERKRVLSDEGALLELFGEVTESVVSRERLAVSNELLVREPGEWVRKLLVDID
jgi:hypothetical protein